MNEDFIERYDAFNSKVCPYELIFGNFNYQPIPTNYYDFLYDDGDDGNNISVAPVYDVFPEN